MTDNIKINALPNLHTISGKNLHESSDEKYKEYRKKWSEWPENFYHGNFPLFLDIEVTNNCNYKCKFCATTYFDSSIKKGFIDYDTVKKIIDEGIKEGLYGVKFNDRGEPLLHKEIVKFVKYAKVSGLIDVYFNTNAILLKEETAEALIEAGVDRISISIEGYNKDVYEKFRVGGDFERVFSNIKKLKEVKKRKCSEKPKIRIQTVLLNELSKDLNNYANFWSPFADEICYIDYKEESDSSLRMKDLEYPWACHQLWQRMIIWWDGTILPCNEDDRGQFALGNIRDRSIKSAWDSIYHGILREKHIAGKSHEIPVCNTCYLRDSEIKKLIEGCKK